MWNQWNVTGTEKSSDSFARPWNNFIVVIGYELMLRIEDKPTPSWLERFWPKLSERDVTTPFTTKSWFAIGSTIQPDAMLWLPPGQTHAKTIWPPGRTAIGRAGSRPFRLVPSQMKRRNHLSRRRSSRTRLVPKGRGRNADAYTLLHGRPSQMTSR